MEDSRKKTVINWLVCVSCVCMVTFAARNAQASLMVYGDAVCDGSGKCRIDNLDPIDGTTFSSETFQFTARGDNQIKVVDDGDGFVSSVFLYVHNMGNTTINVDFDWRFLDPDMKQTGPGPYGFTSTFESDRGGGNPCMIWFSPFDDFVLKALELSITCRGCMADQLMVITNEFYAVSLSDLDDRSNVVPLPATVWFLGSGLIGVLGLTRKSKRKFGAVSKT